MSEVKIQANLSIEKSGGAEKLQIVIDKVREALSEKYPNAQIDVRKGYFQTIDGIWSNNQEIEQDIRNIVDNVRAQVV